MATTTNFGWDTPDDTDLVKDGALAIRTLGSSIDTSFVDLKGGTTGQVLSKASNTDLDYTWIANDQGDITEVSAGTGISVTSGTGPVPVVTNTVATTFDAKGDLVAGTGADTFAKLTVGANNTVLTADSSTATGLKWATPAAGSFTLINTGGTTLSGASVSITSIPATYKNLYIVALNYRPANDGATMRMQLNSQTGNVYIRGGGGAFGDSFWTFSYSSDNGTSNGIATMTIYGYAESTWKYSLGQSVANDPTTPANASWINNIGLTNITSAITSIQVYPDGGNFTSGTLYVYGVN